MGLRLLGILSMQKLPRISYETVFSESLNMADGSTHVAVKLFAKRMHSAWCFSEYMTKDSLINVIFV